MSTVKLAHHVTTEFKQHWRYLITIAQTKTLTMFWSPICDPDAVYYLECVKTSDSEVEMSLKVVFGGVTEIK